MYKVISYQNKSDWDQAIERMNTKDVHYFHGYCELYYKNGDGEPFLFVYENDKGNRICYAFIKRTINLPFIKEELYDIITALGYGGPLYDTADPQLLASFCEEFHEYCREERIVSEFVRFNPLFGNSLHQERFMDISYDRETAFIDLNQSEEGIFDSLHRNHKRNVKRAVQNQLVFKAFTKAEAIEQSENFFQLYKETMEKVKANSYYYFSAEYFYNLLTDLQGNAMIGAVYLNEKMISAAVCLHGGGYLHYHLGGSKKDYLSLGSNVFLFYHISLWGRKNDCHSFHLGGGHIGRDTLFQFKNRFNPNGILQFNVGKKIHLPEKYQELVNGWEEYYSQPASKTFFPAYRPVVRTAPRPLVN